MSLKFDVGFSEDENLKWRKSMEVRPLSTFLAPDRARVLPACGAYNLHTPLAHPYMQAARTCILPRTLLCAAAFYYLYGEIYGYVKVFSISSVCGCGRIIIRHGSLRTLQQQSQPQQQQQQPQQTHYDIYICIIGIHAYVYVYVHTHTYTHTCMHDTRHVCVCVCVCLSVVYECEAEYISTPHATLTYVARVRVGGGARTQSHSSQTDKLH